MALVLERVDHAAFAVESVSDEDVRYTLDMCREINRIYQTYQDGCIDASAALMSGLVMTRDMLKAMSAKVTVGMPAMRIAVAAAQTEEIVAVLYGQAAIVALDPATQTRVRRRHRAIVTTSVKNLPELPASSEVPTATVTTTSGPAHRRRRGIFRRNK